MNSYIVGATAKRYRCVSYGESRLYVVSFPEAPRQPAIGIAQEDVATPGQPVSVADTEGDHTLAEAAGPFPRGAWLTPETDGRLRLARPATRDHVIAIAREAAERAGQLVSVGLAPKGLTT